MGPSPSGSPTNSRREEVTPPGQHYQQLTKARERCHKAALAWFLEVKTRPERGPNGSSLAPNEPLAAFACGFHSLPQCPSCCLVVYVIAEPFAFCIGLHLSCMLHELVNDCDKTCRLCSDYSLLAARAHIVCGFSKGSTLKRLALLRTSASSPKSPDGL